MDWKILSPLSDVELNAVVERITSVVKFHDADGVKVISDFDALPAKAKEDAKRQGAGKGDVEGVFHNGTIYLIADMIRDETHAETVLFHEAAHRGLRGLYSDAKVKVVMNRLHLAMGGSKGFNRMARKFGVDLAGYREQASRLFELTLDRVVMANIELFLCIRY